MENKKQHTFRGFPIVVSDLDLMGRPMTDSEGKKILRPGYSVDADEANKLPVGSRVCCELCHTGDFHEKISHTCWNAYKGGETFIDRRNWDSSHNQNLRILRIGPASE